MPHYKDTENKLHWLDSEEHENLLPAGSVKVTEKQADAIRAEQAQAAQDAMSYAEKRAAEYPPMTDYLDGIVKGDKAQVQAYIDACKAVKAKYPKPTA